MGVRKRSGGHGERVKKMPKGARYDCSSLIRENREVLQDFMVTETHCPYILMDYGTL